MIEPLSMVVGVAILGIGVAVGRAMRPKPPKPAKPLQAFCSCGHGYGQHEEGGRCGAEIQRGSRWDSSGSYPVDYKWVPCACRSYDGPAPLSGVWVS